MFTKAIEINSILATANLPLEDRKNGLSKAIAIVVGYNLQLPTGKVAAVGAYYGESVKAEVVRVVSELNVKLTTIDIPAVMAAIYEVYNRRYLNVFNARYAVISDGNVWKTPLLRCTTLNEGALLRIMDLIAEEL